MISNKLIQYVSEVDISNTRLHMRLSANEHVAKLKKIKSIARPVVTEVEYLEDKTERYVLY
jgi:hypothetical protein